MSEWLNRILGTDKKAPSDLGEIVEGVAAHSHCDRCGKAITLGKRYCSDLCKRGEGRGPGSTFFWIILLLMLMMLLWR